MAKSQKQITCEMVGIKHARMVESFSEVAASVRAIYPKANQQGSAGGWSWTDDSGQVVAASCMVQGLPFGRHWLAIKAKIE